MIRIPGTTRPRPLRRPSRYHAARSSARRWFGTPRAHARLDVRAESTSRGGEAQGRDGKGPGWNKAKSVILVISRAGPSHLDLWDPKENMPDKMRSAFNPIKTKIPGVNFTEILPKLAQVNDKMTMLRAMSYTPNGLFNHTAAIYPNHDRLHDR